MEPGIGKKRTRDQPVFYDEKKQKYTITLTPKTWKKLQALAVDTGVSASEFIERTIRAIDSDDSEI
ncbi:ribbon-helix-helix protein, CopG family [Hassallia byssoidea VB512170]|uniref:Ribbon-helix-helix protein, CopG family n=1 Tax=Hassallia byssoidea VB512170 TaxID=1304833 RepID=A0A846H381_9CYAN|nr:ribbon-helix-helix protein, CopG family [Hassalia byssoidea]NEU71832.1 ribbon-helix-helix protein, CopG family [Hassalia byssoidea VB512170]